MWRSENKCVLLSKNLKCKMFFFFLSRRSKTTQASECGSSSSLSCALSLCSFWTGTTANTANSVDSKLVMATQSPSFRHIVMMSVVITVLRTISQLCMMKTSVSSWRFWFQEDTRACSSISQTLSISSLSCVVKHRLLKKNPSIIS